MLTITETHHNGRIRTWTADGKEDFVLRLLAAHQDSGSLSPDISYEDAVEWLRADLRSLEIATRPDADFPDGLTGESAYYAADGPRDQAVPELQRIEAVARAHGTEQSVALADEARTYLAWLADHDSCDDMPEDWEAA